MKGFIWLVVAANLAAHGWGLLVFMAAGRVLFNSAVVVGKDDAYVLMALEAVAALLTAALGVRLLGWSPNPKPGPVQAATAGAWGGRLARPSIENPPRTKPGAFAVRFSRPPKPEPDTRRLCPECKKENVMTAKACSWCGTKLRGGLL